MSDRSRDGDGDHADDGSEVSEVGVIKRPASSPQPERPSYGGVPLDFDPDEVEPANTAPAPDLDHEITQFYLESFPRLVALLMWMNASHSDALDCAHDAIEKAVGRWEVLRNPYPWCRTTMLRIFYKRSDQQRREPPMDPQDASAVYDRQAEDSLAEIENQHHMLEATKRLSAQQRVVVALTYDGATSAEIATELGLPPATVRSRLSTARQIMRNMYKEDE